MACAYEGGEVKGGEVPQFDATDAEREEEIARARLRGFGRHLIGFFIVIAVLAVVNFWFTPDQPWVFFPAVAWGTPLALHAAWAMGLFDGLFSKTPRDRDPDNGGG